MRLSKKTKQKEQSLKQMNALVGPLKMYICRICLKKFDHIEEIEACSNHTSKERRSCLTY